MERNDGNNGLGSTEGQSDANEFSGSATSKQGEGFDFSGTGTEQTSASSGVKDRAKSAISSAGDRLSGLGSSARERVGTAKDKLADALESGASKLRHQGGSAALAGVGADGSTAITTDGKLSQASDKLAGGMQASADWLRDADLDSLKTGVEQQVKEHPGRTLLIAAGLGYLIGRAFRNNQ
jgi:ElaB/YqjD/DUF883 family membrane-anchored ribosome-binding protein